MNKLMKKAIGILSWIVGSSLILSILMGGIAAYGIPYQGLDMPIRLQDNEEMNWSVMIREQDKFFAIHGKWLINDKTNIFKAAKGYLGEAVCIGRGPPQNDCPSYLGEHKFIDRNKLNIKELIGKT